MFLTLNQLNDQIECLSKEKHTVPQIILWQFMAERLLDHGLAACVASDAHSPDQRSTYMGEVRSYILDTFGEGYTELLLTENPRRILRGESLLGYRPIPFI